MHLHLKISHKMKRRRLINSSQPFLSLYFRLIIDHNHPFPIPPRSNYGNSHQAREIALDATAYCLLLLFHIQRQHPNGLKKSFSSCRAAPARRQRIASANNRNRCGLPEYSNSHPLVLNFGTRRDYFCGEQGLNTATRWSILKKRRDEKCICKQA